MTRQTPVRRRFIRFDTGSQEGRHSPSYLTTTSWIILQFSILCIVSPHIRVLSVLLTSFRRLIQIAPTISHLVKHNGNRLRRSIPGVPDCGYFLFRYDCIAFR